MSRPSTERKANPKVKPKRLTRVKDNDIESPVPQTPAMPQMTREEFEALPLAIQRKVCDVFGLSHFGFFFFFVTLESSIHCRSMFLSAKSRLFESFREVHWHNLHGRELVRTVHHDPVFWPLVCCGVAGAALLSGAGPESLASMACCGQPTRAQATSVGTHTPAPRSQSWPFLHAHIPAVSLLVATEDTTGRNLRHQVLAGG